MRPNCQVHTIAGVLVTVATGHVLSLPRQDLVKAAARNTLVSTKFQVVSLLLLVEINSEGCSCEASSVLSL